MVVTERERSEMNLVVFLFVLILVVVFTALYVLAEKDRSSQIAFKDGFEAGYKHGCNDVTQDAVRLMDEMCNE